MESILVGSQKPENISVQVKIHKCCNLDPYQFWSFFFYYSLYEKGSKSNSIAKLPSESIQHNRKPWDKNPNQWYLSFISHFDLLRIRSRLDCITIMTLAFDLSYHKTSKANHVQCVVMCGYGFYLFLLFSFLKIR